VTAVVDEIDTPLRQPPFVSAQPVLPTNAPERLDHHDRSKIRAAAYRAMKLWPGPIGILVSSELLAFEELGYRSSGGLSARLVDVVLKTPEPVPAGTAA
jgi:hypothetical protein